MNFCEELKFRGEFRLQVFKCGELVEDYQDCNLIVSAARDTLARLIGGDVVGKSITQIAFGSNGTGPVPSDSAIITPFTKVLGGHAYPAPGQVRFDWNLATTEANGLVIKEFGLIASDGTLFARKTRSGIEKQADLSLAGSWTIFF